MLQRIGSDSPELILSGTCPMQAVLLGISPVTSRSECLNCNPDNLPTGRRCTWLVEFIK